jgi:hypothetical protein
MNFRTLSSCLLLTALSATLTSCGGTKVTNTAQTSVGQQLSDLENARQRGIVTEKEYARLKKAIIKNND